jgi:hypothetical protein
VQGRAICAGDGAIDRFVTCIRLRRLVADVSLMRSPTEHAKVLLAPTLVLVLGGCSRSGAPSLILFAPSSRTGCFVLSSALLWPSWPAPFSSLRGFRASCRTSSSFAYRSGSFSRFSHGCNGSGDAMKAAGAARSHPPVGKLISLAILAIAVALAFYALHRSALLPSTDAATIDADIVHVAASVGGRIISIPVAENARVSEGDLLLQIDPAPYQLAVAQAEADLAIAEAALATQQRALSTQRSAATVATEQTQRATANLELATRTVERLRPLAAKGYVPTQQLDQAQTAQRDAETSL